MCQTLLVTTLCIEFLAPRGALPLYGEILGGLWHADGEGEVARGSALGSSPRLAHVPGCPCSFYSDHLKCL